MNKIEKQILKNQVSIISALETLLINTGLDISKDYKTLSESLIDTLLIIDEEERKNVNKQ